MANQNYLSPAHYSRLDPEPIEVIRRWGLWRNYYRSTVLKYIARAGWKGDELEDLKKAAVFLQWDIERVEAERASEVVPGA